MKLHIIRHTHRAIVWNTGLVSTRVVKAPLPKFHRKTIEWEEVRAMRLRRRSAALRVEPVAPSQAKPAAAIAREGR